MIFVKMVIKNITDVGVYVKDLSVYMVNTADDMDKLMTMGNKNRSIGATQMNAHSSRSHAIFSITIECSGKSVNFIIQGKFFIDFNCGFVNGI